MTFDDNFMSDNLDTGSSSSSWILYLVFAIIAIILIYWIYNMNYSPPDFNLLGAMNVNSNQIQPVTDTVNLEKLDIENVKDTNGSKDNINNLEPSIIKPVTTEVLDSTEVLDTTQVPKSSDDVVTNNKLDDSNLLTNLDQINNELDQLNIKKEV